ncbi:coiled-coil domain-containing protein-domain-containing protein [Polychytrium aggregatum]|uniref:coiled-coil domain-containing protein-domain-containing protein n=1 Tax=Polychytrium aggregatum TaxID=110093 RepID=UPI0022FF2AF7|nr:coiled-coil domain-containing protein-domain-containing protein [Polychytrium aggregatum]KAI9197358.1 coiled-coil domain-containing protein-domain-containing protein [Polychytrium aggregatum]
MDSTVASGVVDSAMAASNFFFKPLGPNDPDPAPDQIKCAMMQTLNRDPSIFLEKWGKFLPPEQLSKFRIFSDNYEVSHYLNTLAPVSAAKPLSRKAKNNRRLQYISQHAELFEESEMKQREPVLYEEYIGRYESKAKFNTPFPEDMTLVERIYFDMDEQRHRDALARSRERLEEQFEEFDSDPDDGDSGDNNDLDRRDARSSSDQNAPRNASDKEPGSDSEADGNSSGEPSLPEQERLDKRGEFLRLMQERFLDGRESGFDYDAIDDTLLDDHVEAMRDEEDTYFDSEEPMEEIE